MYPVEIDSLGADDDHTLMLHIGIELDTNQISQIV